MEEALFETWEIHCRIGLFLLAGVEAAGLSDCAKPKTRSVGDHFAHIHNVRLMWLKSAAPNRLEGLAKLEGESDLETLRTHLEASGREIGGLLRDAVANGGRVKGFKPHVTAFLGYLISHEAFHIGKIDLILRQNGHPVSDKVHFGLWEWGVR